MEAMIKIQTNLKCAIENDLFGLSQDLTKQYISILESFEPVFITDESAIQHELNHRDELTFLEFHFETEAKVDFPLACI